MAEYVEREAVLAEIENDYKDCEKIKTPFLQIIVGGLAEKPCYSILWWDVANKEFNVGYSSYFLDYVLRWREVVFEVIDGDVAPVVRCEDCIHRSRYSDSIWNYLCNHPYVPQMFFVKGDHFCACGERRADNESI